VTGGESAAIGVVAECRREATSRKVLVRVQPGPLDVGEISFVEMPQNVAIDAVLHGVSNEDSGCARGL